MIDDIFAKDLSGGVVSPNGPGYGKLIMGIFATIKTATEMSADYRTHGKVHEYMEHILDEEPDAIATALPPPYIDYDKPVNIGKRCFTQQCCTFFGRDGITIGSDALIGSKVNLIAISHDPDPDNRSTAYGRPTMIKDKVWISINSTILPGVRISCGAMMGAGSVVTKDIPATTVVADNPAQIIKEIEASE